MSVSSTCGNSRPIFTHLQGLDCSADPPSKSNTVLIAVSIVLVNTKGDKGERAIVLVKLVNMARPLSSIRIHCDTSAPMYHRDRTPKVSTKAGKTYRPAEDSARTRESRAPHPQRQTRHSQNHCGEGVADGSGRNVSWCKKGVKRGETLLSATASTASRWCRQGMLKRSGFVSIHKISGLKRVQEERKRRGE